MPNDDGRSTLFDTYVVKHQGLIYGPYSQPDAIKLRDWLGKDEAELGQLEYISTKDLS